MKKAILLIASVLLIGNLTSNATHIIGGEWSIQWISGNTYKIRLNHYRDCKTGAADFQTPIPVGIYDKVTNVMIDSFCMTLTGRNTLSLGDSCYTPTVCVELGYYELNRTLPTAPNGAYIAYSRCCRNGGLGGIVNIQNPGKAGEVWYAEFPNPTDAARRNSTPVFGALPKGYMCANLLNTLDFSATDADGDSLVYSLITPLNGNLIDTIPWLASTCAPISPSRYLPDAGPYSSVIWQPPYSAANMVGGAPPLTINSKTGIATATPPNLGVFVFCVRVEEYRGGVKLGEVRKDVQYSVLSCAGTPPTFTTSENMHSYTINVGDTVDFDVFLSSNPPLDSIFLYAICSGTADLFHNGSKTTFKQPDSSKVSITQHFSFIADCNDTGVYHITFIGIKHRCFAIDTVRYLVDITVLPPAPQPVPSISLTPVIPATMPPYVINVGDSVIFDVTVTSNPPGNTVYLYGTSPLLNGGYNASFTTPDNGYSVVTRRFSYVSSCDDIEGSPYRVTLRGTSQKSSVCLTPSDTIIYADITIMPPASYLLDTIPNIFTPNGDHKNDSLSLYHASIASVKCWKNFNIKIFNRWGQLQYESSDINFHWDGKNKGGSEVAEGVYYYLLTAEFIGKTFSKKGTVNVKL